MGLEFVLRFVGGIIAGVSAFQLLSNLIDLTQGGYKEQVRGYVRNGRR